MNRFMSHFGHPHGLLGHIAGRIMAVRNRERIDWAVDLLNVQPTNHVLDIGFGPGVSTQRLLQLVPQGKVAGIDASDEMVQQARSRNAAAVKAKCVDLRQGTAEHLPYPKDEFDKVLVVNSLHHWSNPQAGLGEVLRVLKPGGLVGIAEQPYAKPTDEAAIQQRGEEIRMLLSQSGFHAVDVIHATLKRGVSLFARAQK